MDNRPKPETSTDPDALLAAIKAVEQPAKTQPNEVETYAKDPAKKAGMDFGASVLGGTLLGLVLDMSFDWLPWATIGFMFGGFAVGLVNIWRALHVKNEQEVK